MLGLKLSELLAQPQASSYLRQVVAKRRFGNAYLFYGPNGVGKLTAAFAFARAILCAPGDAAPAATGEPGLFDAAPAAARPPAVKGDDACGECAACRKSGTLQHPDLRFLYPVSGEEKGQDEAVAEIHQTLRDDPLYVFRYDKYASIRLAATRDLLRELAFRPYEAEKRVVVVRDADRMREDQYSALLKSIEEPGASTVWVLTTSRMNRLPATIRSRCQKVRLVPLTEPVIRKVLEEQAEVDHTEAQMLAALSSGSLGRALEMRETDIVALRNESLDLFAVATRGAPADLWKASQAFMRFGRTGREALRRMLEFQRLWLRDLLRARYGAPKELLANQDREREIQRLAPTIDATEIRRRLMVVEEMLRSIEGNITADLTLFSGLARVAGTRFAEGDWPVHGTGRWEY